MVWMDEIIRNVSDCSRIVLKIKVLGYKNQGESIIFELVDSSDDAIIYIGCVDSYELSHENKTLQYLNSLHNRKLDFFCWSHPDNDHSQGLLDIYRQACDGNTLICIPATLDEKLNKKLDLSDANRKIYDEFDKHNNSYPGKLLGISTNKGDIIEEILIKDSVGHEVEFRLWGVAPNGGIIRNWRTSSNDRVKNILSVCLVIQLGAYRFILGGDVPNESIEFIYRPHLKDPVWLKLPHHGSDTGIYMADCITYDSRNLYACTTIFKPKNLPHDKVLDLYMNRGCSRIDSTHTGNHSYGVVDYCFNLFDTRTLSITHSGNACKIRP